MKSPVPPLRSFLQEQQILDPNTTVSIHIKNSTEESFIISEKTDWVTPKEYQMYDFEQLYSKLLPLENIIDNAFRSTQISPHKVEFHNEKIVTTFYIDISKETQDAISNIVQKTIGETSSVVPVKLSPESDGTLNVKTRDDDSIRFYNFPADTTANALIRKLTHTSINTNPSVSLTTNPYMFHYFEDELRIYTETSYQNCTDISLEPYFQTLPKQYV